MASRTKEFLAVREDNMRLIAFRSAGHVWAGLSGCTNGLTPEWSFITGDPEATEWYERPMLSPFVLSWLPPAHSSMAYVAGGIGPT